MTLDRPRRDRESFADLAIRQSDGRQPSDALLSQSRLAENRCCRTDSDRDPLRIPARLTSENERCFVLQQNKNAVIRRGIGEFFGGDAGTRTPDPLHAKQQVRFSKSLLYQGFQAVMPLSPHLTPHEDCLKNRPHSRSA